MTEPRVLSQSTSPMKGKHEIYIAAWTADQAQHRILPSRHRRALLNGTECTPTQHEIMVFLPLGGPSVPQAVCAFASQCGSGAPYAPRERQAAGGTGLVIWEFTRQPTMSRPPMYRHRRNGGPTRRHSFHTAPYRVSGRRLTDPRW